MESEKPTGPKVCWESRKLVEESKCGDNLRPDLSDDSDNESDNESGEDLARCPDQLAMGTIQWLQKSYDMYIEKVFNNIKVEENKGRGYTKGSEYEELLKVDPVHNKILEEACMEFVVCPLKCQQLLIENRIIDCTPDHMAKFLYSLPVDFSKKTSYMFDTRDGFAQKVKNKFVECFSFSNLTVKDFLLLIITKLSPPSDCDKRQQFYRYFWEEYALQNSEKFITPDNVEIILNCIFFFVEKKQQKLKHSKVTLDQFVSYAEEQGESLITVEEAKRYYTEIQENKFLPHFLDIKIGIEGKYSTDKNVNFIRKVKNFAWKATPGDLFFWERTKMYKLQFKGLKIKKKEICLDEKETKLLWFNVGKKSSHSLKLSQITDVEVGITDTFLKYMKEQKFQELIEDDTLWLSIKTDTRSYDFYGFKSREIQTWYDRLKIIVEVNNDELLSNFYDEKYEPSLLEVNFDKVKEVAWESKIIPYWDKYFDCSQDKIVPINYKDIKVKYEIPKIAKRVVEEIKKDDTKTKNKSLSFCEFIMCGIPCKIRALIYPVIIPNTQNINQNMYNAYELEYKKKISSDKPLKLKYHSLVTESIAQYKNFLEKSEICYDEFFEKVVKTLYILFEVQRPDMYFSGRDIVMIWFHFALYLNSDSETYKWFANFVLSNDMVVNNMQRRGVDESDMFSTIEINTICISEVRAKTTSDASTEFIIHKLRNDFKKWGLRVISSIGKSGLKLKDYINSLRMSFMTWELPVEFTSVIIDHYIIKGEYALVCTILYYLKLKWDEMRTIKNKGLTLTRLLKTTNWLELHKDIHVKSFNELQGKYKSKLHLKNIFDTQIRMN